MAKKWIRKKDAVIDQTRLPASSEESYNDRYKEKYAHRFTAAYKSASGVRDKLLRLRGELRMASRLEFARFLGISKNRLDSLLNGGLKLRPEEEEMVDKELKKRGIEIKKRIISFE